MQIFNSLDQLNIREKTSVALGNFDGLHIGHKKIMESAIQSAKKRGFKSLCFTFSNHPFNFILHRDENDSDAIKLICSEDEKISLISDMGFDILVNIPFDEQIMTMPADDFFSEILLEKLNAGSISVGFNYSYGARAGGNPETLKDECSASGIELTVHDAVKYNGQVVSSTLIRDMIKIGNMDLAAHYLGRPYSFKGTVKHGNRIGSAMGIPTANIPVSGSIALPPNGVYFSRILIDGIMYNGVSNLGKRPTVSGGDNTINIETYIFDFSGDLYGKDIVVYFDFFSRAEVQFSSKEALFKQIENDCLKASDYYKKR